MTPLAVIASSIPIHDRIGLSQHAASFQVYKAYRTKKSTLLPASIIFFDDISGQGFAGYSSQPFLILDSAGSCEESRLK